MLRAMNIHRLLIPALLLALPLAVACGGDDDADEEPDSPATSAANETPDSNADNDIDDDENNDEGATGGSISAVDPRIAEIDLCPMLTDEEANEVANDAGLGGNGVIATYTVTRERGEYTEEQQSIRTRSSCRFLIQSDGGGLGIIQVVVTAADDYESLFKPGGEPIEGLGDDAVNNAGTIYARVGELMMSPGESSVTNDFEIEIFRKIAPDLE